MGELKLVSDTVEIQISNLVFNEIIILNTKNGKPFIKLIDKTKKIVERKIKRRKYKISLSIADEKKYAVAFVTISLWKKIKLKI